jgi:hypothetical protein
VEKAEVWDETVGQATRNEEEETGSQQGESQQIYSIGSASISLSPDTKTSLTIPSAMLREI